MTKSINQLLTDVQFDALTNHLENTFKKNPTNYKKTMELLFHNEYSSFNELLVFLFSSTPVNRLCEKIAYNKCSEVASMDKYDVLQGIYEYILSYDFNVEKSSHFNDLKYLLGDFKQLAGKQVQTEVRRLQKAYRKDGKLMLQNVGFKSTMIDKKETIIDMSNLLDKEEMKAFSLYIQGYKVRDINDMVKNGRRKYDSMKAKVEAYYWEFQEDYSQIFGDFTGGKN